MLQVQIRAALGDFRLDTHFQSDPESGILAVAGVSGAGKSSLLRCIAGLHRPTSGRIVVGERVLFDAAQRIDIPPHHRRLGVVFQDSRLFPHLTVHENLRYGHPSHGTPPIALDDVVSMLGIGALLERRPRALSGGEKQRVAIGRALLSAPDLLLLDEPLASLDPARRIEVLTFLATLPQQSSIPIVAVTHDLDTILQLADALVVMEQGRVVATGAVTETVGAFPGVHVGDTVVEGTVIDTPSGRRVQVAEALDWMVLGLHRFQIGQRVRLRVPADDVLLAVGDVPSMSVRNRMAATITHIDQTDRGYLVSLTLAAAPAVQLRSRVSAAAVTELRLSSGTQITALVKAASIRLPGAPPDVPDTNLGRDTQAHEHPRRSSLS